VTRGKPPASKGVVRVGERKGSARKGEETTLSGRSQPMDCMGFYPFIYRGLDLGVTC
jgi:hypothetical protein